MIQALCEQIDSLVGRTSLHNRCENKMIQSLWEQMQFSFCALTKRNNVSLTSSRVNLDMSFLFVQLIRAPENDSELQRQVCIVVVRTK